MGHINLRDLHIKYRPPYQKGHKSRDYTNHLGHKHYQKIYKGGRHKRDMGIDWNGNKNSIFKTLGASNHTDKERQSEDYYATEPRAAELLLEVEDLDNVYEVACGQGHLAEVFDKRGILGKASDLVDRGYGEQEDFFNVTNWDGDIVTNPPYKYAQEFVEHAIKIIPEGKKVCMFLKVQFLEGKARKKLFTEYPPKVIYVSSSRLLCAKNGEFERMIKGGGSAVAYAWWVWVKGDYSETIIKWIN